MLQQESVFCSHRAVEAKCPKSHVCYHSNERENRIMLNRWTSHVHTSLFLGSVGKSYEIVVHVLVAFRLYLSFWDDTVMMFSVRIYGFVNFFLMKNWKRKESMPFASAWLNWVIKPLLQRGSAGMGHWCLGWHCWKTCLHIQILWHY